MPICEVCENDYDKAFEVILAGRTHIFDSFECAIHALAPRCEHCHCKIIGHGVEANAHYYCCARCAAAVGIKGARDRVRSGPPPSKGPRGDGRPPDFESPRTAGASSRRR